MKTKKKEKKEKKELKAVKQQKHRQQKHRLKNNIFTLIYSEASVNHGCFFYFYSRIKNRMFAFFRKLFGFKSNPLLTEGDPMKKFLIAGLGNIGPKYHNTRHNVGFQILDALAEEESLIWETVKLGDVTTYKKKGRTFLLLKPSTFMNLSGKAIKYWLEKEKIPLENLLVVTDDLNLPFGTLRIKGKGSSGGHNGLTNINEVLGTQNYARFRFGIGNDYPKGRQVEHVLGTWNEEESEKLPERLEKSGKAIVSFAMAGLANTMNTFNGK